MIGWLIYYKDASKKNESYINLYVEEGRKLGVEVKLILVEELNFGVKEGSLYINHKNSHMDLPDFAICRAIYPLLNRHLEDMGIKVFNNSKVASICNDKARTHQYLARLNIPMIDSEFCLNCLVEDRINNVKWPTVVKTVEGHGGNQVFLLGDENNEDFMADKSSIFRKVLKGIGKSHVVIQPLIGSRYQDVRVYVIGKEIIAAVIRTARDGFKSNFSLGGEVRLYHLSDKEKDLVNLIIKKFNFGLVGIDFIVSDQGKLIFNEIEDVVGSRMLYQCSDINIAYLYLQYIKNQVQQK